MVLSHLGLLLFLFIANSWSHNWNNLILYKGGVYTDKTYYVEEIFLKYPGSISSYTVRRLTPYYFKGNANNFISPMKMGTERTLYQTEYSAGTYFDDEIRYQYNIHRGVFINLT